MCIVDHIFQRLVRSYMIWAMQMTPHYTKWIGPTRTGIHELALKARISFVDIPYKAEGACMRSDAVLRVR